MKTILSLCFVVLAAGAAHAQILRPESVTRNSGTRHHGARGGDVTAPAAAHRGGGEYVHRGSPYVYRDHGRGYGDYGGHLTYVHRPASHGSHHPRSHGYYGYYGHGLRPGFSVRYYPGYDYGYGYPAYGYGSAYYPGYGYGSYGAQGLFWGGLAGAIIGNNSGTFRHNAWRGAAWGAGAGWLLGTIADANRRAVAYETPVVTYPATAVQAQPAAAAQPQQVTIINNYYNAPATPMSAANGLFGRQ